MCLMFPCSQITWADLAYYVFFSQATKMFPEVLQKAPKLKTLMQKIENVENIKKYLAERPETEI